MGQRVKRSRTRFTVQFDSPTNAVQEHGAYGDEGKAVERGGADGFAVCKNTLLLRLFHFCGC
jgi:hypothetical protein